MFLWLLWRYNTARGIIDALFGPKAYKDFPRNRRLKGNGCDSGIYPSSLGGGRSEYIHTGIDLLADKGDQVKTHMCEFNFKNHVVTSSI